MKFLRIIPIAMAVIVAMATVASSATKMTTLGASPDKLVLRVYWGSKPAQEVLEKVTRKGAKHCEKYGKVVGSKSASFNMGSPSGVFTFLCVADPQAVSKNQKKTSTEIPKKAQKKKRSRLLKSWE